MKKLKLTKDNIQLIPIIILSAILNFWNLSIEGTGNSYYAAAVKSMTLSFKNFFFVSFDPAGFVSIDKPPVGFWLQAISAKLFGFSGVSILLPQALAGVLSVILLYIIVKKSFGKLAALVASLCLAITPVFVAVSRNNTIDNILILALLLACLSFSKEAESGKLKYLIICMVFVGIGFNIKMLQAYMLIPALYLTYLFSTTVSLKKRIINLLASTLVLVAVSMSWAIVVDLVPASSRPYVDSSTNNTVSELIFGHNGAERISLSSSSTNGGGGKGGSAPSGGIQGMQQGTPPSGTNQGGGNPPSMPSQSSSSSTSGTNQNGSSSTNSNNQNGSGSTQGTASSNQQPGNPPSGGNGGTPPSGAQMGSRGNGGGMGSDSSGLSGSFGGETTSSIIRLFSKNILSDQIVWFIPLALLGFIAAALKEKLAFKLNNKKKQALALWFLWFLPEFIYFSFNTGTFHSYYLTMLAPPIAALAGIGFSAMWEFYKEGVKKAWFLPSALLVTGAVHMLMLYYFISYSNLIRILMILVVILCFIPSIILAALNLKKSEQLEDGETTKPAATLKTKKLLVSLALVGILITPFVGSATVLFTSVGSSFPAAGLELLSSNTKEEGAGMTRGTGGNNQNSKLINFLLKNKTNEKYLLVVSNSNSASEIIINSGEAVMSLGGFLGNDNIVSLAQFKQMVKNGEIRYVMTGGQGGQGGGSTSSTSAIMTWVKSVGTLVDSSEYSDTTITNNSANSSGTSNSTNASTNTSNSSSSNTNTTNNQQPAANNNQSNSSNTTNVTNSSNSTSSTDSSTTASKFSMRNDKNSSEQLYDLKAYTDGTTK